MNCPDEIADIVLLILRTGVVNARNGDTLERASLEADHVHNLPDMLMQYEPEKLIYYWDTERTSYVKQLRRLTAAEPAEFAECWQQMEPLIPQARASLPAKSKFWTAMREIVDNVVAEHNTKDKD